VRHPAKFTDSILSVAATELSGWSPILDMFAGTGKVYDIINHGYEREPGVPGSDADIIAFEIEPEWANMRPGVRIGDALNLPLEDDSVSAIFVSPVYGNRCSDKMIPSEMTEEKMRKRNTYTHCLGRQLNENNAGSLQFGKKYMNFHLLAWKEATRVFNKGGGGPFLLNISNHIRKGKLVDVTSWHVSAIKSLGFELEKEIKVETPRFRYGQNRELRCEYESVCVFRYRGD